MLIVGESHSFVLDVYVPEHLCVVEMHAHGLSKQVRTVPIIPALNWNTETLSTIHVGT